MSGNGNGFWERIVILAAFSFVMLVGAFSAGYTKSCYTENKERIQTTMSKVEKLEDHLYNMDNKLDRIMTFMKIPKRETIIDGN